MNGFKSRQSLACTSAHDYVLSSTDGQHYIRFMTGENLTAWTSPLMASLDTQTAVTFDRLFANNGKTVCIV